MPTSFALQYDTEFMLFHYISTFHLSDEWTMEDKVTFEQAFQYHGKNFQRIRAMVGREGGREGGTYVHSRSLGTR